MLKHILQNHLKNQLPRQIPTTTASQRIGLLRNHLSLSSSSRSLFNTSNMSEEQSQAQLQQQAQEKGWTKTPDITLYTSATPNGIKISMALEELGLPYKTVHLDISTDVQKEPWFLEINPNGRIPAITDSWPPFSSSSPPADTPSKIRLFESGSILQYLIDHYDPHHTLSFPKSTFEYHEMISWLFFQNAGVGPMQGQANHFYRYAPEKIPYGITRYQNETRRLYSVLDTQLAKSKSGYLVGDHISIADISTVGWVWSAGWAGVDINEFPNVKKWEEKLWEREALSKGRDVPTKHRGRSAITRDEEAEKKAREWILRGMNEDAKKNQG